MSQTNFTMLDQAAYMSVAAPTVSAVSPATGTISGGTAVTVTEPDSLATQRFPSAGDVFKR